MAKKSRRTKQVEMPDAKWYAHYTGQVLTGEILDAALREIQRAGDGNKACRSESLGVGPWYAVKVARGCAVQTVPDGAVGPYLQANIAVAVSSLLNTIAPDGPQQYREKKVASPHAQIVMELEDVK